MPRFQGEEGGVGRVQEVFWAVEIFCMILQWQIQDMMCLSEPTELYNTESELLSKLWTLLINTNIRLISCNKCTLLMQDVNRGNCVGRERGYMELSVLSAEFSCKPKTDFKNNLFIKKNKQQAL